MSAGEVSDIIRHLSLFFSGQRPSKERMRLPQQFVTLFSQDTFKNPKLRQCGEGTDIDDVSTLANVKALQLCQCSEGTDVADSCAIANMKALHIGTHGSEEGSYQETSSHSTNT
jgi:hypothetical protein